MCCQLTLTAITNTVYHINVWKNLIQTVCANLNYFPFRQAYIRAAQTLTIWIWLVYVCVFIKLLCFIYQTIRHRAGRHQYIYKRCDRISIEL